MVNQFEFLNSNPVLHRNRAGPSSRPLSKLCSYQKDVVAMSRTSAMSFARSLVGPSVNPSYGDLYPCLAHTKTLCFTAAALELKASSTAAGRIILEVVENYPENESAKGRCSSMMGCQTRPRSCSINPPGSTTPASVKPGTDY